MTGKEAFERARDRGELTAEQCQISVDLLSARLPMNADELWSFRSKLDAPYQDRREKFQRNLLQLVDLGVLRFQGTRMSPVSGMRAVAFVFTHTEGRVAPVRPKRLPRVNCPECGRPLPRRKNPTEKEKKR